MNSNIEENDSDFVRLLKAVKTGQSPADALFVDPLFNGKLRLITRSLARTTLDAEDLENEVRFKVFQHLEQFKPNYENAYGNFFAWVQRLAQNSFYDAYRRRKQLAEEPVDDLTIADPDIDIEGSVLYHEVMAEFEKSINALPDRERLAIAYYLQGFTLREISDKMHQAGFSFSHETIRRWISDGIRAHFTTSADLEHFRPKNLRVKTVRATRAKKEFYTIVDRAITSGVPTTIVSTKRKEPSSRPGWESAKELLKRMQSSESKQGIRAAFEASPKSLGRAAVEYSKTRKIPISTLATMLMEASTINVVGRVMNLTKDVA